MCMQFYLFFISFFIIIIIHLFIYHARLLVYCSRLLYLFFFYPFVPCSFLHTPDYLPLFIRSFLRLWFPLHSAPFSFSHCFLHCHFCYPVFPSPSLSYTLLRTATYLLFPFFHTLLSVLFFSFVSASSPLFRFGCPISFHRVSSSIHLRYYPSLWPCFLLIPLRTISTIFASVSVSFLHSFLGCSFTFLLFVCLFFFYLPSSVPSSCLYYSSQLFWIL